jgi:hypothetical protein
MKMTPFINKKDLSFEVSIFPLFLFKLGLIFSMAMQVYGYFRDSSLIFGEQGLFPPLLVNQYLSSRVLSLAQNYGPSILCLIFGLSVLTLFKRSQRLSFITIALLQILLNQRNFIFSNGGDSSLVYFCLMAALSPVATWSNRRQKIFVAELLPLFLLHSIIYFLNFIFKISSAWGRGDGLRNTLSHVEMLRLPVSLSQPQMLSLNYLAILIILVAGFSALVSVRLVRVRTILAVIIISYHLVANLIMRLSWLSLPFIFLEIAMCTSQPTEASVASAVKQDAKIVFRWPQQIAFALLLIGFFNIREVGDLSAFDERSYLFFGHNWHMFAPPPPMTGEWHAFLKSEDQNRSILMPELKQKLNFYLFQHEYKYFFNLRRTELVPVVSRLGKKLCELYQVENPREIQLVYSGHLFDRDENFEIKYEPVDCKFSH